MAEPELNDDFRDLLQAFEEREVDFVIVGAHAMAVHGVARATGDIDILVRATSENALRVVAALRDFGAPLGVHGTTVDDFTQLGWVYQMGLPPRRIDLLTSITGVSFDEAWRDRCSVELGDLTLPFIGVAALRANKLATGRPKDLADVALLDELHTAE